MRWRPSRCKQCRRPDSEVRISKRGLCTECGITNQVQNANALRDRTGVAYDRYLTAQVRAYAAWLDERTAAMDQEWRAREQANTHRAD